MVATKKPVGGRWLRIALGVLAAVAVVGLVVWGIAGILGAKPGKTRQAPKISLMPDKPPPPPPPPKEEKKPEPKDQQKEMKVEPPKEPIPQAQNEPLKMEGAAGDGPSAFAAGSVSQEYKGGSVGGRMAFAFYTNNLQRHLQDELARHKKLKGVDYRVTVRVWLSKSGAIQRVDLAGSSGNGEVDETLRRVLADVSALREPPPENMPQPIKVRITNRGAA